MCPDMAWIRMDLMLPFSPGGLAEEHSTALVSEKTGDVAATERLGDFSQASCAESRRGLQFLMQLQHITAAQSLVGSRGSISDCEHRSLRVPPRGSGDLRRASERLFRDEPLRPLLHVQN